MASYVIRGGEEGKTRLSVVSAALAPSTALLLGAVGVREGMRVLDVGLDNEVARRRGGDPEIGPKVFRMFRAAGLVDLEVHTAQPVFVDGAPKRIHQITLENVRDSMAVEGVATAAKLDPIARELDDFCAEPDTIVAYPRIFQVFGRRPG